MDNNNFSEKLYGVTLWRIRELKNIEFKLQDILNSEDSISKSFFLRASIALIYAHWEGAIKDIFRVYLEFIRTLLINNNYIIKKETLFILELILYRHIDNNELKNIICDVKTCNKLLNKDLISIDVYKENIIDSISLIKNNKNIEKAKEIEFFLNQDGNCKIIDNVVNTESNLGFEILEKIFNTFNIIMSDDIKIEQIHIDQLLRDRNNIAHGDNKFFYDENKDKISKDIKEVIKKLNKIIYLIENIKNLVEEHKRRL